MFYRTLSRFRQGLGRLIRNENDKGIIVSFDDRLIRSNYKQFFESLESYHKTKKEISNNFQSILKDFKR